MSFLRRLPATVRERLERKRRSYAITFLDATGGVSPHGAVVLADLKRFCQVTRGGLKISRVTGMTDPYATAYAAGARDVFLRITEFLRLDGADIREDDSHVDPT